MICAMKEKKKPVFEVNTDSVPPAKLMELILAGALESLVGSLDCLKDPPKELEFAENLSATYFVCRSELSWLDNLREKNLAVLNSRHRAAVRAGFFFVDEMRKDDLVAPVGPGPEGGYPTLGWVSGEDDPRAAAFVALFIDFMTACHLILHYDCKPAERNKVLRLFESREISGSSDWIEELAGRIEKRKPKKRDSVGATAVQV